MATGGRRHRHGPVLLLRFWQLRSLRWCFSVEWAQLRGGKGPSVAAERRQGNYS